MTGFKSTKLTTRKGCMLNDPPKMVHRSTKRILIIVSVAIVVLLIIISGWYLFLHNKSYKNHAIERGDGIYLNGIKYSLISESDLNDYTILNVLIGKTDTGMKLYEIKEYPNYEYVAGYHAWDGEIYKRDETDKLDN